MSAYWRKGEPTEDGIQAYTEGDCWILAMHIHWQTGWPIYLVGGGSHWVVRVPGQDLYLDICGRATRYQLLREWEASSLTRIPDELMAYATVDTRAGVLEEFEGSHRRAPAIAQRLLIKYANDS